LALLPISTREVDADQLARKCYFHGPPTMTCSCVADPPQECGQASDCEAKYPSLCVPPPAP
jgi:hypothetical protein